MQSETGFPSSHQLKFYVAFKSRLKLAARAVLSADAGLLVLPFPPLFFVFALTFFPFCHPIGRQFCSDWGSLLTVSSFHLHQS